jgi:DNA polymerase III epsilon subunit-like protein
MNSLTLRPTDLILDTETTGLGRDRLDEVLELAIVTGAGEVVFDARVRPVHVAEWPDAARVHGIHGPDVSGLPTLAHHWPALWPRLEAATAVWAYNVSFDLGMLAASLTASLGRPAAQALRQAGRGWPCAMLAYAAHARVPGKYPGEYRWHKLQDAATRLGLETGDLTAHSALGDALLTQRLLAAMAARP